MAPESLKDKSYSFQTDGTDTTLPVQQAQLNRAKPNLTFLPLVYTFGIVVAEIMVPVVQPLALPSAYFNTGFRCLE